MRCFGQIATVIVVLGLVLASFTLPGEAREVSSKEVYQEAPKSIGLLTSSAGFSQGWPSVYKWTEFGSKLKIIVIPANKTKKEDFVSMKRDMCVMSHIFDKILQKPRLIGGVFSELGRILGPDSGVTEAICIEGFGALFVMQAVSVAPPDAERPSSPSPGSEGEKDVDLAWKRAEEKLFQKQGAKSTQARILEDKIRLAEEIGGLEKRLIEGLKHATNIQHLRPDEWIILQVQLQESRLTRPVWIELESRSKDATRRKGPIRIDVQRTTSALTIRVKKSDVDAFYKKELDFGQFREKVQVLRH